VEKPRLRIVFYSHIGHEALHLVSTVIRWRFMYYFIVATLWIHTRPNHPWYQNVDVIDTCHVFEHVICHAILLIGLYILYIANTITACQKVTWIEECDSKLRASHWSQCNHPHHGFVSQHLSWGCRHLGHVKGASPRPP